MKKILFLCCMLMYVVLYACPFSSEENGQWLSNRFFYISGINAPDNYCGGLTYEQGTGEHKRGDEIIGTFMSDWFNYTVTQPQNIAPPFTVYIAYNSVFNVVNYVNAPELPDEDNALADYEITLSIQISQNTNNWTTVTSRTFKNWYHPLFNTTGKAILGRYTIPASAFSPLGGNYYIRLRIVAIQRDSYGEVISYMDNTTPPNAGEMQIFYKEITEGYNGRYYISQTDYDTEGKITRYVVNDPITNDYVYIDGLSYYFSPARCVYLKITSARRPTHE